MAVPLKARKMVVTARVSMLKACCTLPRAHMDPRLTTATLRSFRRRLGSTPCLRWSMLTTNVVITGDHVDIDPHFTAQRNALFLARSAIPHALESVC